MADKDKQEIYDEFNACVNMAPKELEEWLQSDESKSVGWNKEGDDKESVGHKSGKRIVEIKRTRKDELTDDQYDHMNKVIGYIHRHLAQRPDGDIEDTNWRYSLMNWGHDPMEDD